MNVLARKVPAGAFFFVAAGRLCHPFLKGPDGRHLREITDRVEERSGMANRRYQTEDTLLQQIFDILTSSGSSKKRIDRALSLLRRESLESGGNTDPQVRDLPVSPENRNVSVPLPQPALIGESPAMRAVYAAIARVAPSPATVLLQGESGTGKELVARALHGGSGRRDKPFVSVHCAAVPESLFESTVFGHERGAFTGADHMRIGQLENASGGTLFLDEIGDIPLSVQVKLLRVLQEREFERVGGTRTIKVDVRLIAATHRDIEGMVRAGTFREDLYYRLNVVPMVLPPLRVREDDILQLLAHFLALFNSRNKRRIQFGDDLLELLRSYHWPGNVRELQNCVERLVVMSESSLVTLKTIPGSLKPYFENMRGVLSVHQSFDSPPLHGQGLPGRLDAIERERLKEALDQTGWVKTRAARNLGLTPRQIGYKMQKYGLKRPRR